MSFNPIAFVSNSLVLDAEMPFNLMHPKHLGELEFCIKNKDYKTIINNEDLFWLAFCKAKACEEKQYSEFQIIDDGFCITFSGEDWIIFEMKKFVEKMRQFILQSSKCHTNLKISSGYSDIFFQEYIKPTLPKLAEFCSAVYTEFSQNGILAESVRIDWLYGLQLDDTAESKQSTPSKDFLKIDISEYLKYTFNQNESCKTFEDKDSIWQAFIDKYCKKMRSDEVNEISINSRACVISLGIESRLEGLRHAHFLECGAVEVIPVSNRSTRAKQDLIVSINSERLDFCIKSKEYKAIIQDKELFWLTYCKALASNEKKEWTFHVFDYEGHFKLSGKEHIISNTQNFVEKMRQFFVEASESRSNFKIFVPQTITGCYLEKESLCLDLRAYDYFQDYPNDWYETLIKPNLPKLAELLGVIYTEEEQITSIKEYKHSPNHIAEKPIEVIRIDWQNFGSK